MLRPLKGLVTIHKDPDQALHWRGDIYLGRVVPRITQDLPDHQHSPTVNQYNVYPEKTILGAGGVCPILGDQFVLRQRLPSVR